MNDQPPPIFQIGDPTLEEAAVIARIQENVARRRAQGLYGPDPGTCGPESLRPGQYESPQELVLDEFPGLHESLANLIAEAQLRETQFSSGLPLLGPLVVAVRRFWNGISTRWYVLPILRQQSEINARTARVISDLAQWHELDTRRLHQLESKVAELEARLASPESGGES
jgi:hypothetical protein